MLGYIDTTQAQGGRDKHYGGRHKNKPLRPVIALVDQCMNYIYLVNKNG